MSGSDTIPVVMNIGQGVSGVYGSVGAFGSGYFPGGRWGAPSWIDSNNHLWLFGGFGYAGNGNFGDLNDLWQFDPSTNYWAYMGGGTTLANSYCEASPTYGHQGIFAPGNVPGGRQSAASWIDKSGNLWLFGGSGAAAGNANACGTYSIGYLNDLWEFNLSTASTSTPEWAWMGGSSAPNVSGVYVASSGTLAPGAREFAATWVDKSGNFWLFGGFGYDANGDFGYLNDLWEFNPNPGEATTNQWTWIDGSSTVPTYSGQPGNYGPLGSSGGAYVPGGRYGASTWTDSSGNFWLFGGLGIDANGNGGNLNDIWEFNPTPGEATTNYWAWMGGSNTEGGSAVYGTMGTPATTNTPGGSYEASSWVDNSGNFWIFGGSGGEPNSVWAFNPPTSQWVWMGGSNTANQPGSYSALLTPAATNIPGGRNQTTSWTDSYGNFWLFGGDGIACSSCGTGGGTEVGAFNDLWVYPPPPICWGPPSTLQISPATLPYVGFVGGSYFQNFTATGGCEAGYVWSITSGATTLTNLGLSFSSGGDLSGYTNAPGSYPFTVEVTDPQGNTGSQDYTLTVYPDITVLPPSLPAGTVGTAYSQQLTASGGAGGPYSFSVISGTALSAVGLTLSPGGLISGTPSTTETAAALLIKVADSQGYYTEFNYPLTVNAATSTPAQVTDNETITVTDAETFPDVVDSEPITVTDAEVVRAYNPFAITPTPASFNAASGNGYATYAYSVPFTATGGIGTLTLTETGALPTGVTFINGVLGGTPVASSVGNTYTFSVTATDADGDSITVPGYSLTIQAASAYPAMVMDNEIITVSDAETFPDVVDSESITVSDMVSVTVNLIITTTGSLPAADLNAPYPATTITASGGTTPYTWSAIGLPAGLSISAGGVITGTPTADAGSPYSVVVKVTDSNGLTASAPFSLTVEALPLTIAGPASLPAGVVNVLYPATSIIASGGSGVYIWSAIGLPAGLSISAGGVITGTPTADAGSPYSVVVKVTDSNGLTASAPFSLTVEALPLTIAGPASLPAGIVNAPYPATAITASGGSAPYAWSAIGLPTGLNINSSTGIISGIPTAAGTFNVTVKVSDTTSNAASRNFSLTVYLPLAISTASPLPTGQVNVSYSAPPFAASGGLPPYTWTATGLPPGLSLSAAGVITGTPTLAGGFTPRVIVTDAAGNSTPMNFLLTVIPPPSLTITANPGSVTIIQGQSGETTLTFAPMNGYVGTLTLGCIGNPPNTLCLFTINGAPVNSVVLTGNNQPLNIVLTIETDVNSQQALLESRPTPLRPSTILTAIAFWSPFSLLGLIAIRRKRKLFSKNPRIFGLCLLVLLVGTLAGLAGCVSGGGFGTYVTPVGSSTMTITATPGSGSAQTLSIGVTITH